MPYTVQQIAVQQQVVDALKEDIKWKQGVSYDFQGVNLEVPVWNGTRAEYWADWRTNHPNHVSSGVLYNADGSIATEPAPLGELDADGNVKDIMWDWWKFEMEYDVGYEQDVKGDWATYISNKQSELATEEATLATMQADPA